MKIKFEVLKNIENVELKYKLCKIHKFKVHEGNRKSRFDIRTQNAEQLRNTEKH